MIMTGLLRVFIKLCRAEVILGNINSSVQWCLNVTTIEKVQVCEIIPSGKQRRNRWSSRAKNVVADDQAAQGVWASAAMVLTQVKLFDISLKYVHRQFTSSKLPSRKVKPYM